MGHYLMTEAIFAGVGDDSQRQDLLIGQYLLTETRIPIPFFFTEIKEDVLKEKRFTNRGIFASKCKRAGVNLKRD